MVPEIVGRFRILSPREAGTSAETETLHTRPYGFQPTTGKIIDSTAGD